MNQKDYLTLIQEHHAIIHKICRLYRERKEDREDLFQEIIFQLWRSFPGFKGTAKVSTWIYRIALNTALATFRKKQPGIDYRPTLPDYVEETQNEEVAIRQEKLFFALQRKRPANPSCGVMNGWIFLLKKI
jgi:RNA polymerase sigma-70 factor (ECF subfamily)